MRSLKKVLALLVVLTMMLSTVAFASQYTDVKDDASYAEAVTTLSSLGLLKGDDKGNFNPDKTITRAEFAAVVVRALGLGDPGKTDTEFTDATSAHWGSGYIKMASQLGIIKGYGNGKFGPDDNVTYEQAVKMVVAALGYTPKAEALGGYPTGYMVVASQEGITKGANGKSGETALRSVVAMLVYNSLEVPLMEQTGFGKEVSYEAMDGKGTRAYKTLLSDKFDITAVKGVIKDTKIVANLEKKDSEKSIDVVDGEYKDDDGVKLTNKTINNIKIGSVNVNDYLGYSVVAYIKDLGDDKELFAVAPRSDKNVSMQNSKDYIGVSGTELRVYEDKADVGKNKGSKIDLEGTIYVVTNGIDVTTINPVSASTLNTNYIQKSDSKVKFIDNDNDGYYDFVFIGKYKHFVVDEVTSKGKVKNKLDYDASKAPSSISFDKDDKEDKKVDWTILLDGKEIEPKDLQEWDSLTVMQDSTEKVTKAIVARKTVDGMVKELSYDDNITTKPLLTVGDKVYKKNSYASGDLPTNYDDMVGKEYTFYLDMDGKIVYAKKGTSTAGSDNYAYLFKAAKYEAGFEKTWQVELFTAKGDFVTYFVADKFEVNGADYDMKSYSVFTSGITNLLDTNNNSDSTRQLVTYKLDSAGKIKELNSSKINASDDDYVLAKSQLFSNDLYKKATGKLGNYFLKDDTIIININNNGTDDDDYSIIKESSFEDAKYYDVMYFDVNDENEADVIVAKNVEGSIVDDAGFFVIDGVSKTKDSSDDIVYNATGYIGGEKKTITIAEDATVYGLTYAVSKWTVPSSSIKVSELVKGDVIQYNIGSKDQVTKLRVVYSTKVAITYENDNNSKFGEFDLDSDTVFAYGEVYSYKNGKMLVGNNGYSVSVGKAVFVEIDTTGTKVSIETDPDIDVKDDTASGSIVLIREYESIGKDVIVIKKSSN